MSTQKWCNAKGCKNFVFSTLDNLWRHRWTALEIPAGSNPLYYCPQHHNEMKKEMYKKLSGIYGNKKI